jgi:uncharacterized protein
MLDRLPHEIDPIAFADKQRTLQGRIPLNKLKRLADLLLDNNGQVEIDLSFAKDGRLAIVRGTLKTELVLQCRNCLEALNFPLALQVHLAVVHSLEQVERLAGEYEPLMLEQEKIPLHELVEDELLLALPDFPRHDYECQSYQHSSEPVQAESEKMMQSSNNPFSVLAKLKNIGD